MQLRLSLNEKNNQNLVLFTSLFCILKLCFVLANQLISSVTLIEYSVWGRWMQKCIERTRMQSEEIIVEQLSVDQSLTVSHNDDRKKYICDFCGLTLFSRAGIRSHILHKHLGLQTVTGAQTKTEVCTVCGVYVTRRNFKDHVNSHSNCKNKLFESFELQFKFYF